jgi:8-oxo-dGTP diphosphatase
LPTLTNKWFLKGSKNSVQSIQTDYLQVTAALITSGGRIFIAQRPPHKTSGLCWEFPGGKVEPGEQLEEALMREIREELCWDIRVGKLFQTIRHRSNSFGIDLHAFWCSIYGGSLKLREHVACHWARIEELKRFELTEADRQLALLMEQFPGVVSEDDSVVHTSMGL